ncbi:C40 family peptidase [Citrobacter rodentium]|uniref:Exported protein n=2 Tax=Citrobacter rodentium TaxID=67825 RepID=D2THI4_CITRI|nr:C40 family peptidase [Citrobacter rodentium]KIQ48630.1 endopeptidase [Citrobacter rodentium]QBY28013.1 peptidoglycan endopeptidase [Citrobacter rodentium]UHO30106.1 C40 family peptidase [Citrobacter rodentium NBRC 105723 = DSM 16636]CBG88178.1 putative exported protein [Citrobacter rodentium ICC168]HAT8014525.1 endopeptidase [Citrobacter rodentium NBRC 105723 = DSM 16636]
MARINRLSITLCALLFITIPFMSVANASRQARATSDVSHNKKVADPKKRSTATAKKTKKTTRKTASHSASSSKKRIATAARTSRTASRRSKTTVAKTAAVSWTEKCTPRKDRKPKCIKVKSAANATLADAHKIKVQKATRTAMNKLMSQIGKPYRWGGASPRTGFDCSGLVYYAYKDLVKFPIPRTANEMYHLRDAAPIKRDELKNGDLVFFRTQGRGTADHVGVYVGNGKFIQSPRTGREIQITSLSEDYWQRHYVGARRVMTPKTIR